MSDKKIIIRNCPAFDSKYNECHSKIEPHKIYCMDCTNCVLKQIVEVCEHYKKNINCRADCPSFRMFLSKLLSKLDIREVE